jgi:Ca2+-binding RTX toxin-like protein
MQESPTEVRCVAEGLEAVDIDAGDLKDEVFFPFEDAGPVGADGRFRATVDGGRGGDEMRFATTVGGEEVKYFLAARGGPGPDVVVARLTDLRAIYEYLLLGGAKTDVVKLSNARGTIKGGGAGDKLKGGKGPQKIFGNGGNDRISCGKGRDKADGGPGKDVHLGGCERFASMDEEDFPFN